MRWFASCIVFAIPLFLADSWSTVVAGALAILWNPIHKDREMEKDLTVLCNISTHLHTGEAKKYISGWNTGDGQYPKFEAKAFLRRREMDVKVDPPQHFLPPHSSVLWRILTFFYFICIWVSCLHLWMRIRRCQIPWTPPRWCREPNLGPLNHQTISPGLPMTFLLKWLTGRPRLTNLHPWSCRGYCQC